MKVRRLTLYPGYKATQIFMLQQAVSIYPYPGQLSIGEVLVDRALADGMQWNGFAPFLRFRHHMMPLLAAFERPPA